MQCKSKFEKHSTNLIKFGETVVNNKSHQTLGKGLSEYKAFKCLDFSRSKALKLQSDI